MSPVKSLLLRITSSLCLPTAEIMSLTLVWQSPALSLSVSNSSCRCHSAVLIQLCLAVQWESAAKCHCCGEASEPGTALHTTLLSRASTSCRMCSSSLCSTICRDNDVSDSTTSYIISCSWREVSIEMSALGTCSVSQ